MEIKGTILTRIGVVYFVTVAVAVGILAKILFIQTFEGDKWRKEAEKLDQREKTILANRGDILDRNDRILASSMPRYDIYMDPASKSVVDTAFQKYLPALAQGLAGLWPDKTATQYAQMIRNARLKGNKHLLLHSAATLEESGKAAQLPLFNKGKYKGGLIVEEQYRRIKPYGQLASRTIGNENFGEEGTVVGLEGKFDYYLKGTNGYRSEHSMGSGVWMPLNIENEEDPKDGLDVVTTLDINWQDVAHQALLNGLEKFNADHGCAILMEVATGEILAMVNLGRGKEGTYSEDKNYAIYDRADPGSTFKVVAIMAALEDNAVQPTDIIDTYNGKIMMYKRPITDSHSGGFGKITVEDVIEQSSNIGMARLIDMHYNSNPDHFIERLYGMGLNQAFEFDITGLQDPIIKNTSSSTWSSQTLTSMAFGYEVEFAPLHILTFYNAIANNGTMVKPRLVKCLKRNSQIVIEYNTEVLKATICSEQTLQKVKTMLEGVVERGTAKNLKDSLYRLAGKTGTAVMHVGAGGYRSDDGRKNYRASFVGYFPAEKPTYSGIVVVTRPVGEVYFGNKVAGEVFKAIADRVYATSLDLHKDIEQLQKKKTDKNPQPAIVQKPVVDLQKESGFILPELTGLGIKDVLPWLENNGYRVKISGFGKIIAQSPAAGTPKDSVGIVELSMNSL